MSETSIKHKIEAPKNINFALIMCSSSRYERQIKGESISDPSRNLIIQMLKKNGHKVVFQRIVSDDQNMIRKTIMEALKKKNVQAIITCGGTGISPKDVTIETVKPLLEKKIDGFGEIFRIISYEQIGSAAILSRALAGVFMKKAIFCLPGSPQSVVLSLEKLILPEIGHILKHINEE